MNGFAQHDQIYVAQQAVDCLNVFKPKLDECKDVDPVSGFKTILLAWDTSAPFGLNLFKSDLVDYM